MEILHSESDSKGAFYISENSTRIAEVTYSKAGDDKIIIDHTEVADAHQGEGIGKKLVIHAAEYARKNGLKVIPLCPYAKSVFRRHEEINDVL